MKLVPNQGTIITNQMFIDQLIMMQGYIYELRNEVHQGFKNVYSDMEDTCYRLEGLEGVSYGDDGDEDIDN